MSNVKSIVFVAIVLFVFAIITELMNVNTELFYWFNQAAGVLPDWIWSNLTFTADTLFVVAAMLIIASRKPELFNSGFVLLIIGAVFVQGFKFYLDIPRPAGVLDRESFNIIGLTVTSRSFPSGHSFTAMALAGLLMLHSRHLMLTGLLLVFGLLGAISRVAVGAHWPLDVFVGSAFGLLFAIFAQYLTNQVAWLQGYRLQYTAAFLMTLTSAYLIFHNSGYPNTQPICIITGSLGVLFAISYWLQVMRAERSSAQ